MTPIFWKNKTVFLTGHTGFKGGWVAHWLSELGAVVHGFAQLPSTQKNFFSETHLNQRIASSTIGDIRDLEALATALKTAKPDIILHMAAQPLVREAYKTPVETFAVNLMGTVNLLEAARRVGTVKAVVSVATDKCYKNEEWVWPYRENDRLGGHDPYSASKACAEIAVEAYRNSFLADANINLASVRAGNVIGGGDWATDRLIPDFLRALDEGAVLSIRSPGAVRPWQHVLDPLFGYLTLAEKLYTQGIAFAGPWNFGPNDDDAKPVGWIIDKLCERAPKVRWKIDNVNQPHEAGVLKLDSSKARAKLGWVPRWNLEKALGETIQWHLAFRGTENMSEFTSAQIQAYMNS